MFWTQLVANSVCAACAYIVVSCIGLEGWRFWVAYLALVVGMGVDWQHIVGAG